MECLKANYFLLLSKYRYSRIHLTRGPYDSGFPKVNSVMAPGGFLGRGRGGATTKQDEKVLKMVTWRRG